MMRVPSWWRPIARLAYHAGRSTGWSAGYIEGLTEAYELVSDPEDRERLSVAIMEAQGRIW